jgi:hypothetical protein
MWIRDNQRQVAFRHERMPAPSERTFKACISKCPHEIASRDWAKGWHSRTGFSLHCQLDAINDRQ